MRDLRLVNALVNQVTSLHDLHQAQDNRATPGDRLVVYCHAEVDGGTVVYVRCEEMLGTTVSGMTVTMHNRGHLEVFFVPDEAVRAEDVAAVRRLIGTEEDEAMQICPDYQLRHRYIPSAERGRGSVGG